MATNIQVNKQTVKQLLETGKSSKFVIPEYQRPYAWSEDQIQTLFDDLVEFTDRISDDDHSEDSTYFLGAIVSYDNNNNEQEIIDGQQRITSLFLFLRALYSKLKKMRETLQSKNFISQIESILWESDELTAEVDYNKVLITSRVMGEEGNKTFSNILITGEVENESKDNYSKNYILFERLIEDYASKEPELFYWLIRNLLNKAILLPITADSQETALTIFSTLNDRGLALSDADIFKAKIYNHLNGGDKTLFIDRWKNLEVDSANANESIQKLFYYYMFYLRGKENDRNTTTPGIRKYYAKNCFERLFSNVILNDLESLLSFWIVVNNHTQIVGKPWSQNIDILKVLDILTSYPNEFWKYPVIIYYLNYKDEDDFEDNFLLFLKKLLATLLAKYITTPTINAVKRGILNLDAEIFKSQHPKFDFNNIDEHELKDKLKNPHRNTIRMILKILAYEVQDNLLPEKWEIEHILPQKWQNSFFVNNSDNEVKELVEHVGNKIPFEKRLNIIASNGYFEKKKESYNISKITLVKNIASEKSDWDLDDIRERDIRISDELYRLMIEWGLNSVDIEENEGDGTHKIIISDEKITQYKKFIDVMNLEDNDVNREKFCELYCNVNNINDL
ncbi:DUF262 domain-containing protein [Streptococcus uberis]|uniref:DUF262 domain-containing protein n=1 Tax=Streptococcus uberis TaxID=1349 RepID=UPI0012B65BA6|nr:DUF262 domain-containing protein [Streptococcus uberis]MTB63130.1 DUF262 domain-containing protein [Streptococcus uberis]MTB92465.1 DUF262 domain-containing protein [Streptococcus uberis]